MSEESPTATPYGFDYYDAGGRLGHVSYSRESPHWLQFFGSIADEIIWHLHPCTVLDVGCAKGFLVECLRDRGVEAYGFDVSEYAIGEVRPDIKRYCWVGSGRDSIKKNYDLITCIEVCEHLVESEARETIQQMTCHTDTILFSSTPGDFEEPTHINVRPVIDWLRLFAQFSFAPDQAFHTANVSPQAMLLRRTLEPPSDQELCRFANAKNQEIARADMRTSAEHIALRAELDTIRTSKGWRLLNFVRDFRSRVTHPVAQGYRTLRGLIDPHLSYDHWIKHVEQRSYDPARIKMEISSFDYKPTISVVMPVYNTPIGVLDLAIQSVVKQHYEKWELCVCDDASSHTDVRRCLERWQKQDARIKTSVSARNEGISAASNRGLQVATGEFVGLLDHDDELSPDALYEVAKVLQENRGADMIYSDEDRLDVEGRRVEPFFKPDWSPEYMLACMYTCHFGVYRKRLLEEIGGFRTRFDGSQDYDLVLRLTERSERILHIPKVLYHWRMIPSSAAASLEAKPYALTAAKKALSEHLERRGVSAEIRDGAWPSHYRIEFKLQGDEKVSILIVASGKTDALRTCMASMEKYTSKCEVVVAMTSDVSPGLEEYLASKSCRIVSSGDAFHPSRLINLGAKEAKGEYLLLLHDDVEAISKDWISPMLGLCQQKEIGAVGAKLLRRNESIEHAGMVLGLKGIVGSPLQNFPKDTRHGCGAATDMRNCSTVSAACMMVRKDVFDGVGGFDESLSRIYSDVDFCLKVRTAGYRIVWTPWAEFYHSVCASPENERGSRDVVLLEKRWGKLLKDDPYYNPNLTLRHEDFGFRV
jgi:GT2 family glycosyltransferase